MNLLQEFFRLLVAGIKFERGLTLQARHFRLIHGKINVREREVRFRGVFQLQ